MRRKKVAWRGCITSAGAGDSCGQLPGADGSELLVTQPGSSTQPSKSAIKIFFSITQSLLIFSTCCSITCCNLMLDDTRILYCNSYATRSRDIRLCTSNHRSIYCTTHPHPNTNQGSNNTNDDKYPHINHPLTGPA